MKLRLGFVSNSSSSSFIIAYDKEFFGDLNEFLKKENPGCETKIVDFNDDFLEDCFAESNDIKNKIDELPENCKEIVCGWIDNDYFPLLNLLKHIGKINKNKLNVLHLSEE